MTGSAGHEGGTMQVSIIIRTEGRRPETLRRALDSVLAQTHRGVEALVVGDGVDALPGLQGRARFIAIAKSGRSAAGNAGLAQASGEALGFLDDDDELFPDHCARLAAALQAAPAAIAAYAGAEEIRHLDSLLPWRRTIAIRHPAQPFSRARLWAGNTMPIQAVLFRRAAYENFGGLDPALDALEDWDLWLRYSRDAEFLAVPQVTSRYHLRQSAGRHALHLAARNLILSKYQGRALSLSMRDIAGFSEECAAEARGRLPARLALARLWRRLRDGY